MVALIAGCAAAAGCGDEKPLMTAPGGPVSENATFTRVQNEVFTPSCALSGCHLGPASQAQEGLVLSSDAYSNIVMVRANQNASIFRVTPGDPANSYLWRKITPVAGSFFEAVPAGADVYVLAQVLLPDRAGRSVGDVPPPRHAPEVSPAPAKHRSTCRGSRSSCHRESAARRRRAIRRASAPALPTPRRPVRRHRRSRPTRRRSSPSRLRRPRSPHRPRPGGAAARRRPH